MKQRLVLDTDVVVSALLSPGSQSDRIMRLVLEDAVDVVFDRRILKEYRTVLRWPRLYIDPMQIDQFLEDLERVGILANAPLHAGPVADEADRMFVDVALTAMAWLVTGSLRRFPPEPWIMTPAQYFAR